MLRRMASTHRVSTPSASTPTASTPTVSKSWAPSSVARGWSSRVWAKLAENGSSERRSMMRSLLLVLGLTLGCVAAGWAWGVGGVREAPVAPAGVASSDVATNAPPGDIAGVGVPPDSVPPNRVALHPAVTIASAAPAEPAPNGASASPAAQRLERGLERALVLARAKGLDPEHLSIQLRTGSGAIAGHRVSALVKPASCLKLLTAAAALDRLGPDASFRTTLYRTGTLSRGVLVGDLIVVGGGDPGRVASDSNPRILIEEWAKLVATWGVTRVDGNLVGDDRYLAGDSRHADWPRSQWDEWYSAPSGALNLNDNCHDIWIRPASDRSRIEIDVWPSVPGLELINELIPVSARAQHRFSCDRIVGTDRFVARGKFWSERDPYQHFVAVSDPTIAFLSALRTALSAEGVELRGETVRGACPPSAILVHEKATPVVAYVPRLLKRSQNLLGDCLQRVLGRRAGGDGSFESGAVAVTRYARSELGWRSEFTVRDGSGLSHRNRVTASELVELLVRAETRPWASVFWSGLPVAGRDGTLARRFNDSPLRDRVRAKTGHLSGVASLAGRVDGDDPLYFSVIYQGRPGKVGVADRWFEDLLEQVAPAAASPAGAAAGR